MCRSIINIDIKILQSTLSLSGHLFKSDTSLRWTPGVGPCHFSVIIYYNYSRLAITQTFKGNQKKFELLGVRVIASLEKITGSKETGK